MNGIPDISKAKVSLTASLAQRKFRKKEGLFVAEGRKCVNDTIGKFELEYLVGLPEWIEDHQEMLKDLEGKVFAADEGDMKKMTSFSTPPEVLAVYKIPTSSDPSELLDAPLSDDLYLLLDSIQDPGNLGTIIRTAHWFGIKRIFASPMTADLYNPKTIQATMGSIAAVQVDYIDLSLFVGNHKGLPVIGLQLEGDDIFKAKLPEKGFIVMGNEGNGISPSMMGELTLGLTIPPYDTSSHPESLNVAVATAITLAQFRK